MPNLSRGVMLEGVSCAGKTSTMYAIKRLFASDVNLERNIVMLGEHYTQPLNSINGELKIHEQNEHIEMFLQRACMIEQLFQWACSLGDFRRASRGLYTVFERGLINHVACYGDYDDPRIIELGDRFKALGFEEIALIISDDNIDNRYRLRAEQMHVDYSGSEYQSQAEQAKSMQSGMLEAMTKTSIPFRIVCTDTMNWDEYASVIVRTD